MTDRTVHEAALADIANAATTATLGGGEKSRDGRTHVALERSRT